MCLRESSYVLKSHSIFTAKQHSVSSLYPNSGNLCFPYPHSDLPYSIKMLTTYYFSFFTSCFFLEVCISSIHILYFNILFKGTVLTYTNNGLLWKTVPLHVAMLAIVFSLLFLNTDQVILLKRNHSLC